MGGAEEVGGRHPVPRVKQEKKPRCVFSHILGESTAPVSCWLTSYLVAYMKIELRSFSPSSYVSRLSEPVFLDRVVLSILTHSDIASAPCPAVCLVYQSVCRWEHMDTRPGSRSTSFTATFSMLILWRQRQCLSTSSPQAWRH